MTGLKRPRSISRDRGEMASSARGNMSSSGTWKTSQLPVAQYSTVQYNTVQYYERSDRRKGGITITVLLLIH